MAYIADNVLLFILSNWRIDIYIVASHLTRILERSPKCIVDGVIKMVIFGKFLKAVFAIIVCNSIVCYARRKAFNLLYYI